MTDNNLTAKNGTKNKTRVPEGAAMSTVKTKALQTGAMHKVLAFGGLIFLILMFSILSPNFFKFNNIVSIILATCVNGVLAFGITFVVITAGIDLSVGTNMTLSAVMAGVFITNAGMPVIIGILGGILTGSVVGFVNGFMITKMKLPPFIATLGMMMATKGLSLVISGTKPIYFDTANGFSLLSTGSVLGQVIPGFSIPNAVLFMAGAAVIASLVLSKTVLGRYTYALGSNEEATRLSGVNTTSWKIAVYTLCGTFAGLAGVMMASRLNSAQPALGAGYEMDAIAAAVIGGASLSGGEGGILGTVIGAFIISVLTNGLRIMSVPQEWQTVVTGLIVVLAVYSDMARKRK